MLCETVTAYTVAIILENERTNTLRDALICSMIELCPLDGPPALVRTDPAPGFESLAADDMLRRHNIQLELGRAKNKNKNPIADTGIQEFEEELLRQERLEKGGLYREAYPSPSHNEYISLMQ